MAYGQYRPGGSKSYSGLSEGYRGLQQRQSNRENSPEEERRRRMNELIRQAAAWAPAIGGGLGALAGGIGGIGTGAIGGAVMGSAAPVVGTSLGALAGAVSGFGGGISSGMGAGSSIGQAVGSGLQGMADASDTEAARRASMQDPNDAFLMALLSRMV